MLHTRPETFGRKHSLVAQRRSLLIQSTLSDRVGSPSQKRPGQVGSRVKGSDPVPYLSGGALWAPPARFGAEPRPPKGFPLFSALRMTSPDTIILLIVNHHATIGGKTTVPLAYAPFAASPKCLHFLSARMSAEVRIEVMLTYIMQCPRASR